MTDSINTSYGFVLVAIGIAMAVLAIGWAVFRIRTGIEVRETAYTGELDTRDLGVGARYYAPILVLATLVGLLSWLSVRSDGLVQLIYVLGILLCALGIGRLRIAGYRARQSLMTEVRQ